jgi:alpha-tubulin suppressor-like RCC1 family protein
VFIWGRGLHGVLGNGTNNYALKPELNQEIEGIKEEYADAESRRIVKIDAADDFSTILTGAGDLYAWGKNDRGQMGVGSGFGIDMVESEGQPTLVKCLDLHGH